MSTHKKIISYIVAIPKVQLFIVVTAFSIFIRIYLFLLHPPYENLAPNANWYYTVAANLSNGHGIIYSGTATAYKAPATSILLAGAFKVLGAAPFVSASLFVLIFCALIVQGYLLAERLFGEACAKLALVFMALWPEWWFQSLSPSPYILFSTLLITFFNQLIITEEFNVKRLLIISSLTAALLLTHSIGLFAIPIALLFIWRRHGTHGSIMRFGILLCISVLLISPYLYRNYQLFAKPVIENSKGYDLHVGHNPFVTGKAMKLAPPPHNKEVNEAILDEWHQREALNYMAKEPLKILTNIPKKIAFGFIYHINIVQEYFQGTPQNKRQSRFFWMVLSQISYFFLLAALTLSFNRRRATLNNKARAIIYGSSACIAMYTAIYYGSSHFITPLIPLWIILLSYWLTTPQNLNSNSTAKIIK